MAKQELSLQTHIRKSVEADGGYARKLSHKFSVGIPDLFVALPPFAPGIIEVKDLSDVADKFDKLINITPMQTHHLLEAQKGYWGHYGVRVSGILVRIIHRAEHRLVALPPGTERLSYQYQDDPACWTKREKGGYYAIKGLLTAIRFGRIDDVRDR